MWSLVPGSSKGGGICHEDTGLAKDSGGNWQWSSPDFLGKMAKETEEVKSQAGAQPERHRPWKVPGPTPSPPFSPEPPPGASLEAAALALPRSLASTLVGLLVQQLRR